MKAAKFFTGVGIAFAIFPALILLLFYAYVLRARCAVGYWPSHYQPESWSMGFSSHYALLRPWFHVFPLGLVPVVVAIYDAVLWAFLRKFPKRPFVTLTISAALVYACLLTDPGKFINWFRD